MKLENGKRKVAGRRPVGMKVLLDECIPRKSKRSLPGHDCQTVPEAGFAGKTNGEFDINSLKSVVLTAAPARG